MAVSPVLNKKGLSRGRKDTEGGVVTRAVLCFLVAKRESPRIEKNGRGGSPSGPKPQAQTRRFSRTQFLARWPMFRFPASDFRFQNFFCSPRKCPTGCFRMSPEMITNFIQILASVLDISGSRESSGSAASFFRTSPPLGSKSSTT